MKETISNSILILQEKASNTKQGIEALQLSQSALNLAHILAILNSFK